MNQVLIDVENIPEPAWLDKLEAYALAVLAHLGRDEWELSLLLCDDGTIAGLNRDYRGKEGPTDVLSFAQVEGPDEVPAVGYFLAGDIIVSLDSVRSNAAYFGVPADQELKRLVIHGILHLSGLDHASNEPDEPMLALQERILAEHPGEIILTS